MSLLRLVVIGLASLFLFASFAAADKDYYPDHDDDEDKDRYEDKDHDDYHHRIRAPKCCDKKWDWVCIFNCRLHHSFFGHYLICRHCVQTYNSIHQSPCKIAAHLLARCHNGCELSPLFCLASARIVVSPLSQGILFRNSARGNRTGLLTSVTSASATPSYIPSLVHVKHARVENTRSTTLSSSFSIIWLSYLTLLALRTILRSAPKF